MALDNRVTKVPGSAAPDAQGGSLGAALQAAFITAYIVGPNGNSEEIAGIQTLSVQGTYPGAGYQPQASTFRQERSLGARLYTGQCTRIQQRLRPLDILVARVYGMQPGQDVRLDMLPVTVTVQYCLVGPNFDYSQNGLIDQETRTYAECFMTVHGDDLITSGTGNAQETITFESQHRQYAGGNLFLISVGYSSQFPKNAVGTALTTG